MDGQTDWMDRWMDGMLGFKVNGFIKTECSDICSSVL